MEGHKDLAGDEFVPTAQAPKVSAPECLATYTFSIKTPSGFSGTSKGVMNARRYGEIVALLNRPLDADEPKDSVVVPKESQVKWPVLKPSPIR